MPIYEYKCEPCRVVYQTRHGMNENPVQACPTCAGPVTRLVSAASLNLRNHTSPTEAKWSKISKTEEYAREKELQKDFKTMWMPPLVKDDPNF